MKTPKLTGMVGQVNMKHGSGTVTKSKQGNNEVKKVFYHSAVPKPADFLTRYPDAENSVRTFSYFIFIRETPAIIQGTATSQNNPENTELICRSHTSRFQNLLQSYR